MNYVDVKSLDKIAEDDLIYRQLKMKMHLEKLSTYDLRGLRIEAFVSDYEL